MSSAIRLISDELIIHMSNATQDNLVRQKNYILPAPAGKLLTLCFASHQNTSEDIHPLVASAVEQGLGVVYICEKLPKNPIIDPHVVYIEAPYRWYVHTLFMNPLKFASVFASRDSLRLAQAFSEFTGYHIPLIQSEREIALLAKDIPTYEKNVLVEVMGGVGDHLMTIPSLKTLDAQGYRVSVLCDAHRNPCYQNLPYVKTCFTSRREVDVSKFSKIIFLNFGSQLNDYRMELNKQNRIYAVAEICGLKKEELVVDKPEIILTADEINNARRKYGSYPNKIFFGSDSARVDAKIPSSMAQEKINTLKSKGFTVFSASVRREAHDNCIDLNKKLSLRELFAVISLMDAVLTVDTSFLHIAAAFNKKTFCLLNYFKAEWRCSTYPNCNVYNPRTSCYPCVAKQFVASCDWQCHRKSCYEFFDWEKIFGDIYDFKLDRELRENERLNVIPNPEQKITTTEADIIKSAPGIIINPRTYTGKRIAAIWLGGVGDAVMLGYLCRAIVDKYPDCQVDAYVRDAEQVALLAFDYPQVKACISKQSWAATIGQHKNDYDIIYEFRHYPYVWYKYNPDLNHSFDRELYDSWQKASVQILKDWHKPLFDYYALKTDLEITEKNLRIPFTPTNPRAVQSKLSAYNLPEKYITIAPGCDQNVGVIKLWSNDNWAKLVHLLQEDGYKIVYLGSNVASDIGNTKKITCKNLVDMALILSQSQLHISNEGGSVHLAHAVGTKSITLFGPTAPDLYGYPDNLNLYADKCPSCWWTVPEWSRRCKLGHRVCTNLQEISPEDVYKKVIQELA